LAALLSIGVRMTGGMQKAKVDEGNTGTGTVFGDVKKDNKYTLKSESITNAIDKLSDIDIITMKYSAQMASSLRNIESNIGGLTNILIRSNISETAAAGIDVGRKQLSGSNMMLAIGMAMGVGPIGLLIDQLLTKLPVIGSLISKVAGFVYNSKTTVTGSGITGGSQSMADVLANGYNAQFYADVYTRK
jgi:hypothetical protein